ncbi:MAG TPA: cob(I)yrinic acid a,c-diamide adenosyltransferase [Bacteroidota bacterium]|nr:cob(I)yrinic acid a,c-diamide adenosyltransferase [Bacteroidota bacterium]
MSKIYTKTGDDGTTALLGGKRVPKADPRLEVYGTIDELNSAIGAARAAGIPRGMDRQMGEIQRDLFRLGAEIAAGSEKNIPAGMEITGDDIGRLEKLIDELDRTLPPLRKFILPGGHPAAAAIHTARTICRRAERHLVGLSGRKRRDRNGVIYLNRLSDLLFTMARSVNRVKNVRETEWSGVRSPRTGKK